MKQKLLFSLFSILLIHANAQFRLGPYLRGLTNIKDGFLETGIDIPVTSEFGITPFFRLPLSNKDQGLLVLDRNTSEWKFVTAFQYEHDPTRSTGPMKVFNVSGQVEWGHNVFKYYPNGNKNAESKTTGNTLSGEIRGSYYTGAAVPRVGGATQKNFQLRLRYSNQYKAGKEVGVVMPADVNGVVTTSNMVITPPSRIPGFSPAFAYQKYKGSGGFSYTHAAYYDMQGQKNGTNPGNDNHRARYEFWVFYYPVIAGNPNFKLGIGPFISVRTKGDDDFNRVEYGGQITVKLGSLFQSFF